MSNKTDNLIPCREAGCDHAPFTTAAGENLHYHRVHSGRVIALHQKPFGHTKKMQMRAQRNGHASTKANGKTTRKYTKRQQAKQTLVIEAKFCPCCGFNLELLQLAMTLAQRHQKPI